MLSTKYLRKVPLPEDLCSENIFHALQNTQKLFKMIRENTGINLSNIIQANNFSGMVSNVFTKKLSELSVYRNNSERAYPDLIHETKSIGLEVKATKKPFKGGEGHNGHSGWHIVICYQTVYLNFDKIKITPQLKRNREKLSSFLPIPNYSPFA